MTLQTHAPENFHLCRWSTSGPVRYMQTRREDPYLRERKFLTLKVKNCLHKLQIYGILVVDCRFSFQFFVDVDFSLKSGCRCRQRRGKKIVIYILLDHPMYLPCTVTLGPKVVIYKHSSRIRIFSIPISRIDHQTLLALT